MNKEELIEEIEEKKERLNDLETGNCYDEYDEFLDDCQETIKIGGLEYSPSLAFSKVDPIAYDCGYNDWADSEISELYSEIEDLEQELKDLDAEVEEVA